MRLFCWLSIGADGLPGGDASKVIGGAAAMTGFDAGVTGICSAMMVAVVMRDMDLVSGDCGMGDVEHFLFVDEWMSGRPWVRIVERWTGNGQW